MTNPAVDGYTTEDLIRDELPLFANLQPALVTVLIGVNDLVQGRTPDAYRRSLTRIYDAMAGARVVAVSIPNWSYVPAAAQFGGAEHVARLTAVFNDVARSEAAARGLGWVDIGPASVSRIGSAGWIANDGLHPGDVQYAAWAEAIWPVARAGGSPDTDPRR